ncbi:hypothetical protein TRFO_06502 [Tritrichomonas foetus]|uniref:Protein kinase domain-containing protein n=1 Tax=Tritrichomonas foetus TaxID=1144522 RepID=A0A1J4JYD0_9EUKA|nr:hypothetical protein TRFO_06502 [Tritrichomonas foetus]|eukprot:OHT04167.1 hypothetical protein TRFO_06502 [Tritrichomonas foetus]
MIKGQQYTTSADIWSAGVFLYAIVTSRLPFDDVNQQIMLKKIKCAQPNYPSYLSSSLIDLLGRLLTKSPTDRITLDQIKEHPWFSASEYTCLTNYLHNCLSSNQNLNTHRLYFNGVMKDEIDNEILQELEQLGIDVSNLKHKVFARSDDEVVVLYQIKAKSKITNELRNVAKSCPKVASTPEPTNIRFTFDSSKLIAPGKSILKYDQDKIPTIQLNRPNIHNFARQRCVPVIPLSAVAIRGNRSVKSNSIQPK